MHSSGRAKDALPLKARICYGDFSPCRQRRPVDSTNHSLWSAPSLAIHCWIKYLGHGSCIQAIIEESMDLEHRGGRVVDNFIVIHTQRRKILLSAEPRLQFSEVILKNLCHLGLVQGARILT